MVNNKDFQNELKAFEQQLASHGQQFELLSSLDAPVCHLRFTGPFLGHRVIWDASLQTLAYYVSNHPDLGQSARQFIEVGDSGARGRQLTVGLNLPLIDQPAILKAIIMIRQYKLLAPGRHEFGEQVEMAK
ncbi:MAG: hypothetical protein P8Z75_11110 [Gammaproteobacteria bacterium]|jgi:hypothetical protein